MEWKDDLLLKSLALLSICCKIYRLPLIYNMILRLPLKERMNIARSLCKELINYLTGRKNK
ncbi:MAG: hypothetical protein ABRQ38_22405 [Candidatus Eremiobacterota bacterium]